MEVDHLGNVGAEFGRASQLPFGKSAYVLIHHGNESSTLNTISCGKLSRLVLDYKGAAAPERREPSMAFNVFISWSGEVSKSVALVLHDWVPTVIQAAEPFMSNKDIDAGVRGLDEVSAQLKTIQIGLICVTAGNQDATWLNYEAGALSKTVESTYVIPVAFDIDKGQIKIPLGQFQAKHFTQEDMLAVAKSINKALGAPLPDGRLEDSFGRSWPELSTKIERLRSEQQSLQSFVEPPKRSMTDMLDELVIAARDQGEILKILSRRPARVSNLSAHWAATDAALRELAKAYGMSSPLDSRQLIHMAPEFDDDDWRIVENTPFLLWYIRHFKGIERRPTRKEQAEQSNFDDVPF